eukprot:1761497-Heterocapsa_arctica.AAC.1
MGTASSTFLDLNGITCDWGTKFVPGNFYSIGKSGGFGVGRVNHIRMLSMGHSQEGPEGPLFPGSAIEQTWTMGGYQSGSTGQ